MVTEWFNARANKNDSVKFHATSPPPPPDEAPQNICIPPRSQGIQAFLDNNLSPGGGTSDWFWLWIPSPHRARGELGMAESLRKVRVALIHAYHAFTSPSTAKNFQSELCDLVSIVLVIFMSNLHWHSHDMHETWWKGSVTGITTRNSGASCYNPIELQNSVVGHAHANLVPPRDWGWG